MKKLLPVFILVLLLASCTLTDASVAPAATEPSTDELASSAATPTPTRPLTLTPNVRQQTATPTTEAAEPVPSPFVITLAFAADTVCGGAPFAFDYGVEIVDDVLLLTQINAGITTAGPYDAATGAFTTTLGGLPGTETYSGTLTASAVDGSTEVSMSGEYGYGGDAGFCGGSTSSQLFAGSVVLP